MLRQLLVLTLALAIHATTYEERPALSITERASNLPEWLPERIAEFYGRDSIAELSRRTLSDYDTCLRLMVQSGEAEELIPEDFARQKNTFRMLSIVGMYDTPQAYDQCSMYSSSGHAGSAGESLQLLRQNALHATDDHITLDIDRFYDPYCFHAKPNIWWFDVGPAEKKQYPPLLSIEAHGHAQRDTIYASEREQTRRGAVTIRNDWARSELQPRGRLQYTHNDGRCIWYADDDDGDDAPEVGESFPFLSGPVTEEQYEHARRDMYMDDPPAREDVYETGPWVKLVDDSGRNWEDYWASSAPNVRFIVHAPRSAIQVPQSI